MKRRFVIKFCIFLLLGAVVNVAVAWSSFRIVDVGSQQRFEQFYQRRSVDRDAEQLWRRHMSDGWPDTPPTCHDWHNTFANGCDMSGGGGGFSLNVPLDATEEELRWISRGLGSFNVEQIDTGFPFCTLRLERWDAQQALFKPVAGHDGLVLGDWVLPIRILPIRFAISTVFYALAMWLLFAAWFAMRRRFRRKRGLCPECAYPIGTSDVCTECGNALPAGRRPVRS